MRLVGSRWRIWGGTATEDGAGCGFRAHIICELEQLRIQGGLNNQGCYCYLGFLLTSISLFYLQYEGPCITYHKNTQTTQTKPETTKNKSKRHDLGAALRSRAWSHGVNGQALPQPPLGLLLLRGFTGLGVWGLGFRVSKGFGFMC